MIKQLTAEVYLAGDNIVVLGRPSELPIPTEHHNCDAMGCGSVGLHVLARFPVAACCTDPGSEAEPEAGEEIEQPRLSEQLQEAHDKLRAIAVAREQAEGEPVKGSRRLERLRWSYTTLGVIVGHLMREEEEVPR